jgi:hypothetical protein
VDTGRQNISTARLVVKDDNGTPRLSLGQKAF